MCWETTNCLFLKYFRDDRETVFAVLSHCFASFQLLWASWRPFKTTSAISRWIYSGVCCGIPLCSSQSSWFLKMFPSICRVIQEASGQWRHRLRSSPADGRHPRDQFINKGPIKNSGEVRSVDSLEAILSVKDGFESWRNCIWKILSYQCCIVSPTPVLTM